jgi:hypothetical protein
MFKHYQIYIAETNKAAYNGKKFFLKHSAKIRADMLNESMSNRQITGKTYEVRKV